MKLLVCIPIIALVQQGLFFSLHASEDTKVRVAITTNSEAFMGSLFTDTSTNPPFSKRRLGGICNGEIEKGKVFLDKRLYYEQAMRHTEMGLVDLAIPELKKIKELYPNDGRVHAYLGWAYSQKGRISDAVEEFQKALEINPDLQRVPFDYPMVKDIPAVVREFTTTFEDLIDQIDSFSGAHEVLGLCYVLQGRIGDALHEYRKVLQRKPMYEKRDLIVYGRTLVSAIDQAITEYEEVLRSQPDCVEAHITLACAYAEKGMLDEAVVNMKKAISAEPDRIDTHVYLGCFYAKRWMMDEALEELYKAKKTRTHILDKLLIDGEHYIQNYLFDKAIGVAKDALQVNYNDKKAHGLLALAYSKNGTIDKAIETCKENIRLYPDNFRDYLLLGWIYLQCDLPEEAKDLVKQAILIEPDNSEMKALMAFMYAAQNQIHQAIEMCTMIMNKPPSNSDILKDYSWIQGKVLSIEQKFREVLDVLVSKPDYPEAYICLGWLYAKNGEAEKAITSYRKALELISNSYRAEKIDVYNLLYNTHVCLGNIYVQKGEIQDALNEYNKAREILSGKAQDDMIRGLACLKEGDAEQAIQYFNSVLKISPQYKEIYCFLADAYEKKGLYSVGMVLRLQGGRLQ